MPSKKFYITTTLPYVNAAPHIGFALEIVQADIIARYHRDLLGEEVVFNTGTDEHGVKVYRKALEEKKDPQAYADEYAAKFDRLKAALDLSYTDFIRTTDAHHMASAEELWRRCAANGDIEKKTYKAKYCAGCELEKMDSELVEGKCPLHPTLAVELIDEENYFFKFSRYQKPLFDLYNRYPDFVLPPSRLKEIRNFVAAGLQDFSISRLKAKMPWGVPVPEDEAHVMYVWFDALVNYISTLGWPAFAEATAGKPFDIIHNKPDKFDAFWGTKENPNAVQIAGKDNLRQQAAMWQAMLLSAGLPPSRRILIHGFIESGGRKMSKSLGNVVDPFALVAAYGTDALRYWIAREIPAFDDSDFTEEKFRQAYNAGLANGLGNLVSRVLTMAKNYSVAIAAELSGQVADDARYREYMGRFEIQRAAEVVWERIAIADKFIQEREPFKKLKTDPEGAKADVKELLRSLFEIAYLLKPILPGTSEKIITALAHPEQAVPALFPRK